MLAGFLSQVRRKTQKKGCSSLYLDEYRELKNEEFVGLDVNRFRVEERALFYALPRGTRKMYQFNDCAAPSPHQAKIQGQLYPLKSLRAKDSKLILMGLCGWVISESGIFWHFFLRKRRIINVPRLSSTRKFKESGTDFA